MSEWRAAAADLSTPYHTPRNIVRRTWTDYLDRNDGCADTKTSIPFP